MGLLTRLFVWALGFAFHWVLLLSLVLLVVALHPPTLAALVSKMAMAVGGGSAGTGKERTSFVFTNAFNAYVADERGH